MKSIVVDRRISIFHLLVLSSFGRTNELPGTGVPGLIYDALLHCVCFYIHHLLFFHYLHVDIDKMACVFKSLLQGFIEI